MFIEFNLKAFKYWLRQIFKLGLFFQRKGYCILTPSFFKNQKILNFKSGKIISVQVRDTIDFFCLLQIYKHEHYKLEPFYFYKNLRANYNAILKTGKSPLIIDCGANVGFSALYFAEKFPEAKIIAVEPQKDNFIQINHNCSHISMIHPILAGIASENKKATVIDAGRGNWGFTVEEDKSGECNLIAISHIVSSNLDSVPFICKIDIEGFEQDLFSKNTEWFDEFALAVIETHDANFPHTSNSRNFLSTISKYDRDFTFKNENVFSISNKIYS